MAKRLQQGLKAESHLRTSLPLTLPARAICVHPAFICGQQNWLGPEAAQRNPCQQNCFRDSGGPSSLPCLQQEKVVGSAEGATRMPSSPATGGSAGHEQESILLPYSRPYLQNLNKKPRRVKTVCGAPLKEECQGRGHLPPRTGVTTSNRKPRGLKFRSAGTSYMYNIRTHAGLVAEIPPKLVLKPVVRRSFKYEIV
mgnify:CR=1 FL=1